MSPPLAYKWFRDNAHFPLPRKVRPKASRSSNAVKMEEAEQLHADNPPVFAFKDQLKLDRLITALDDYLVANSSRLSVSLESTSTTDNEIEEKYKDFFGDAAMLKRRMKYDQWFSVHSEAECLNVFQLGPIAALRFVMYNMFDIDLKTYGQPPPPTQRKRRQHPRDRVDYATKRASHIIFLTEGKGIDDLPQVSTIFEFDQSFNVNIRDISSEPIKIINKAIYYMCIYDVKYLVLTNYFEMYLLEVHTVGEKENKKRHVSWSVVATMGKGGTAGTMIFRVLLALTLHRCGVIEVTGPNIEEEIAKHEARQSAQLPRNAGEAEDIDNDEWDEEDAGKEPDQENNSRGSSDSGGGDSGRGSSRKRGREPSGSSNSGNKRGRDGRTGRCNAGAREPGKYSSERRTKTYSVGNVSCRGSDRMLSVSEAIGSHRLTRSMSRQLLQSELLPKPDTSVIMIRNCPYFDGDAYRVAEFERDEEQMVQFPSFPTQDEVPVLEVPCFQDDGNGPEIGEGRGGTVYKARLLNPSTASKGSFYAIKLVDAEWRSMSGYSGCLNRLHDEYMNYCWLQYATRHETFVKIIRRFTPVCYGLYHFKDGAQGKFALIMQYVPEQIDDLLDLDIDNKYRVMEALLCLHSIGLAHRDVRSDNMLKDGDKIKLIDFSESEWHQCDGLPNCSELILTWRLMFHHIPADLFQDRVKSKHILPFVNLEEFLLGKRKEEKERCKKQLGRCLISNFDNSQDEDV